MAKISENTPITISLVMVIIGGVVWLSTLYAHTEANSKSIDKISTTNEEFQKEVIQRLTRLEALIERRTRRAE